jgi:hypothetical protein
MIAEEEQKEISHIANCLGDASDPETGLDLEATEFYIRSHLFKAGAKALERLISEHLAKAAAPVCNSNHLPTTMKSTGKRPKTIRTIFGEVPVFRRRYQCPICQRVCFPADNLLGVGNGRFSPGLQRMMAHVGAARPFAQSSEDLRLLANVKVDAKEVERIAEKVGQEIDAWMQKESGQATLLAAAGKPTVRDAPKRLYVSFDGTGVPMTRKDLEGRPGKNGPAKTREVKVGCVFTQTTVNDEGFAVRDEASTSYVAAIEESVDFGYRIRGEAIRRGLEQAQDVTVLTDGQTYNKSIVQEHFSKARHIVDVQHAKDHLTAFTRDVAREEVGARWHVEAEKVLLEGRIEDLVEMFRKHLPRSGKRRKAGQRECHYFESNKDRMRYAAFRAEGCFIGSGVVEAACRVVVGQRLKNSGMFWSVRGANAILALRCATLSNRFENFWENRAA